MAVSALIAKEPFKAFFDPAPASIEAYWPIIDQVSLRAVRPFRTLGRFSGSAKRAHVLYQACDLIEEEVQRHLKDPAHYRDPWHVMGLSLGRIVLSDPLYLKCFRPYWVKYAQGHISQAALAFPASMLATDLGPIHRPRPPVEAPQPRQQARRPQAGQLTSPTTQPSGYP